MGSIVAVPWNLADAVKGVAVVVFGGIGLFTLAVVLERTGVTGGTWASILAAAALEGILLVVAWNFSVRRYQLSLEALGFRSVKGHHFWTLPFVALGASLLMTGVYVVVVTGLEVDILVPPELPESFDKPQGIGRLATAFVVVVLAPIAEETFFRGFVFQGLIQWAGPVGAAIASSVLFSLSHGSLGLLMPTFLSGMVLAWVFMKTRSLTPAIFAHSMQNFLAFTLAF